MNAALPLSLVVLAGAVALTRPAADVRQPLLVEMEVSGVLPLEDAHAAIVVLKQKGREILLPIVVGSGEGDAVTRRLNKQASLRPRTHDLLEQTIGALGGRVVRVEIRDASAALYRARIFLAHGAERVELDARPSDSIALAIGAHAPIFVARELVDTAGLAPAELERLRKGAPRAAEPDGAPEAAPEQRM